MSTVARVTYFKRYRMELRLANLGPQETPRGFTWLPWARERIDMHARVLYDSFQQEIDAKVFPNLADLLGCTLLMAELARKSGFVPEATWLLAAADGTPVASIQGLQERGRGAIQNVGVVPGYRGVGLGSALLLQALHGFRRRGLAVGSLEVTGMNEGAIRLYRRHGFRKTRTMYRVVAADGGEVLESDDPRDWQDYDYD